MQIHFHSRLWSYLPKVPIFLAMIHIYMYVYVLFIYVLIFIFYISISFRGSAGSTPDTNTWYCVPVRKSVCVYFKVLVC